MSVLNISVAVFLGLLGLGLIFYIAWTLLSSFLPNLKSLPEKLLLKRKQKSLTEADLLLNQNLTSQALPILRSCFILDHIKQSEQLIDQCSAHNLSILSRLLTIADAGSVHISSIAVIEDLLGTRQILLKSYIEVGVSAARAKQKKSEGGKNVPEWALAEFYRKRSEVLDKLKTNSHSINSQLADLLQMLERKATSGSQVTYH